MVSPRSSRLATCLVGVILVSVVVVLNARVSHADKRSEAEALFRAGERLFDAGNYNDAAEAFEKAFEVLPLPAIAFSAAQAYRLNYFQKRNPSHLKRAVGLYRLYIREQRVGGRMIDATNFVADLEPVLLAVEKREAVGVVVRKERTGIVVTSSVDGAMTSVNGSAKKKMPLPVELEPGRHHVVVTAAGYAPFEKDIDIVSGQTRAVDADLVALPAVFTIVADAGSTVRVNGRAVGKAPFRRPISLVAGTYNIEVTRRGYQLFSRQLVAGRGDSVTLEATLKTTRQRKISYVFLATAAAVVGISTITGIAALSANGDAKDLEAKRQRQGITATEAAILNRHISTRDNRVKVTLGLFGAGIAAAAAGGLLYYLDNPSVSDSGRDASSPTIQPIASVDGAGLALSGSF